MGVVSDGKGGGAAVVEDGGRGVAAFVFATGAGPPAVADRRDAVTPITVPATTTNSNVIRNDLFWFMRVPS